MGETKLASRAGLQLLNGVGVTGLQPPTSAMRRSTRLRIIIFSIYFDDHVITALLSKTRLLLNATLENFRLCHVHVRLVHLMTNVPAAAHCSSDRMIQTSEKNEFSTVAS